MKLFSSICSKLCRNISSNTTNNSNVEITDDNSNTPQSSEALAHTKSYTKLLSIYISSVEKNVSMKMWFKIIFFIITMGSLVTIVCLFCFSIKYSADKFSAFKELNSVSFEAILSVATIIVPAIVSLVVAFIKIPEIIAQYLFNIQEDNYMDSVIKNIQDYDKTMFAMEHQIEETLFNNKLQADQYKDDDIEDLPESG